MNILIKIHHSFMRKKSLYILLASSIPFMLSNCVPVIIGGFAGGVGTATAKKKGLGGSITDTGISMAIKMGFSRKNTSIGDYVRINVQNRHVLLYGAVPNESMKNDAEKVAWDTDGVFDVKNHIIVSENIYDPTGIKDASITTQIKTSLLCNGDIKSINYSVTTYRGEVYLMGISNSKEELQKVIEICSNKSGVEKVIDHVIVCERPSNESSDNNDVDESLAE